MSIFGIVFYIMRTNREYQQRMNIHETSNSFLSSPAKLATIERYNKYRIRKAIVSLFEEKRHQVL